MMQQIIGIITLGIILICYNVLSTHGKHGGLGSRKKGLKHRNNDISQNHNVRGINLFFHEITSGTCASHGFDTITSSQVCLAAAKYHDHNHHKTYDNRNNDNDAYDELHGCYIQPRLSNSVNLPKFISSLNNKLVFNQNSLCRPDKSECQCTSQAPCFCTTNYFIERNYEQSHRRTTRADGQFVVTWDLSLGGREDLLESAFLKAAFEQSVKDYINNDILCSDNIEVKGAEFFGVDIPDPTADVNGKRRAISGNGKCKGDVLKCKKPVKGNGKGKKKGDDRIPDASRVVKATHIGSDFCETFLASTIFDAFAERLLLASAFNYAVDVDVINDLEGNLDLSYDVSFEPAPGDGLDQVDDVDMEPNDPVSINPVCAESQCSTQREVMRKIFVHFGIPIEKNKHECLYQGINCNEADMVTHIWMVNYGFQGKTIPDFFRSLPSLVGLFLGGNGLTGTIPRSLGVIQSLKMLWLENNSLTGTIPTNLGNLRGLFELNLHENRLDGSIPSELGRLKNLRMLNVGRNNLSGSIPTLHTEEQITVPEEDCSGFLSSLGFTFGRSVYNSSPNPFKKIFENRSTGHVKKVSSNNDGLVHLQTLTLYENSFEGSIPVEFGLLSSLADFNVAGNDLTGSLPIALSNLRDLRVLDVHGNSLTGSINDEISGLKNLQILNLYGNYLDNSIPTSIGDLLELKELVIDNNRLTGPIPTELGNLKKLKYLTFGYNRMSGDIPSELGNLVELDNLDLRGYSVSKIVGKRRVAGTIPTALGKLTKWKYVVFEGNGVEGTVPLEFGNMSSSKAMWMKNQNLSGEIPTELAKVKSMSLLSVGNNNMDGSIPSLLGEIGGLKQLDIGSNAIAGGIPTEIGKLKGLQYMNLGNPDVSGTIPTEMGDIGGLEYLMIAKTQLSGDIPSEIGKIGNLKSMGLSAGNFTGKIPSEIGLVSTMKRLALENNGLSGSIPTEIGNVEALLEIKLTNNSMTGQIPSELGKLQNLRTIDLNQNDFTGRIPSELGLISSLENVMFCDNLLSGTIPIELTGLTELRQLVLCNNELSGTIPSQFGVTGTSRTKKMVKDLEVFDLGGNVLSGTIPTELGSLTALIALRLGNNVISGNLPSELGNMNNLEVFDVGENIIEGTLPTEFGRMNSLLEFSMGFNDVSGTIPTEIGLISGLEQIYMMNNKLSGTIPSEMGLLNNLRIIDSSNNSLTGSIPSELGFIEVLELLDFGDNELTGLLPTELESLPVLVLLETTGNNITGDLWYICSLRDYSGEDLENLDCSNYCGTPDEECTSLGVGNATCSDVGCNGGGKPACNTNCRLDYSVCDPGPEQSSLQLDLNTDSKGRESSWQIIGETGVVWEVSVDTYRNLAPNREFRCVVRETDCHVFKLLDSGGDGLCCNENEEGKEGNYQVWLDGELVDNPPFNSLVMYQFGCPDGGLFISESPSLPPSRSPQPSSRPNLFSSMNPSSSPTLFSSTFPTLIPSVNPSSMPSFSPSQRPSILPSPLPSIIPSIIPSSMPSSEVPSNYPTLVPSASFVPSTIPTFRPSIHPSLLPSRYPSLEPSHLPSLRPSQIPSLNPSNIPSAHPSLLPTQVPSIDPFIEIYNPEPNSEMFGTRIAQTSDRIFVSNYNHGTGAVHVFDYLGVHIDTLRPSDGAVGDEFGKVIAIKSNHLLIGAPNANGGEGAVYYFSLSSLFEREKLIASDHATQGEQHFGSSVDVSSHYIFVGAPNSEDDEGKVYTFDVFTRGEERRIVAVDSVGKLNGLFGSVVAVIGNKILIGSPGYSQSRGAVYMYDENGILHEVIEGFESGDRFGSSVAATDDRILIGAPNSNVDGVNSGSAYVYNFLNGNVHSNTEMRAESVDAGFNYGYSVGAHDVLLVGSPKIDDGGVGALYVFDGEGNEIMTVPHPFSVSGDQFGYHFSIGNGIGVVGAPKHSLLGETLQSGIAYIFRSLDFL